MLNLVTKAVAKIFGSKSDRDVKELLPIVEAVNKEFVKLAGLSHDELRGKTTSLKARIATHLTSIDAKIDVLKTKLTQKGLSFNDKEGIFAEIEVLDKDRNKELEVVLNEILPEAFAVVKETAKRFRENEIILVTATDADISCASRRDCVTVEGETAHWKNSWSAAGAPVKWDMVHYDVQLIGGAVLHQGKISEMATGEGKTLVATLPAYLNALAGRGVHIVTVNDYLSKRDSDWMAPIFEFHGLRVDCIDRHEPNTEERRNAYLADLTYGTNNEFGFDYLRDNMARHPEDLVQRKLHYAMVDEVDSVLIDDARTPLIISGPMAQQEGQQLFEILKPRVAKMVDEQRKLAQQFLTDAKKFITEGNEKEGGLALLRAHKALPKARPLIKFLSETGNKSIMSKVENSFLEDNARRMPEAVAPLYFTIDEKNNGVDLTQNGIKFLTQANEDPRFFMLPDLSIALDKVEKDSSLSADEKVAKKDAVITEYSEKANRIHTVQQLLKAYTVFEKEVEYIIQEGKIKIVDEQTGRIMEGRRYSDGLHQALEAKENVHIEDATQTYATVTLQNYFRMYHKLAGMTGTAETEAGEFWQIYKLDVVVIPTNRAISRKDEEDKIYKTVREKYNAVADEIAALVAKGRPVLVGTTSVENSEVLSRMLRLRQIKHNVLNAKYHQREAEIVAEAGISGTVTIATNMAGRGTDIKLSPESKAAGGLAIIGTERHESRRVDRQLRGRSGRQGDPGTSVFFVSLEDSLMRLFGSDRIMKLMDRLGLEEGEVIQHSMITSSIERAQKKVEENNFGIRKRLLDYDDVMNSQREVIYKRRRNALFGERMELDVMEMIYASCSDIVENYRALGLDEMRLRIHQVFGLVAHSLTNELVSKAKPDELKNTLFKEMYGVYQAKVKEIATNSYPVFQQLQAQNPQLQEVYVFITDFKKQMQIVVDIDEVNSTQAMALPLAIEKYTVLNFIDNTWKEHLRIMDDLRQDVQNASYEQKDPLLIYKFQALKQFKGMITELNNEVTEFIFKYIIPQEAPQQQAPQRVEAPQPKLVESKASVAGDEPEPDPFTEEAPVKQAPIRKQHNYQRNDKVSVRYMNGEIRTDVKFKTIEDDFKRGMCEIVNIA
jgi:preprotein translocase subunit SecA